MVEESPQTDQLRVLVPVFAVVVAIVAAVTDPSSAADLLLAALPVGAFAVWAYVPRLPLLALREIRVLDCASLVVFKALFNRTRDWADIEAVAERSPAGIESAAATIEEMLGANDALYRRLVSLTT